MVKKNDKILALRDDYLVERFHAINKGNIYSVMEREDSSLYVIDDIGKYYDVDNNSVKEGLFAVVNG